MTSRARLGPFTRGGNECEEEVTESENLSVHWSDRWSDQ